MKTLFFAMTIFIGSISFAGPGHDHSHGQSHSHNPGLQKINKEDTGVIGRTHVQRLVNIGKLDKTWLTSSFAGSKKKVFGKRPEWIVTFENKKSKKGKKKLYIFLKESGAFIAANFTGK